MVRIFAGMVAFLVVGGLAAVGLYGLSTRGEEGPSGLARPTATPDVRETKDAAAARAELAAVHPGLAKLLDAIAAGDVDGVLAQIDWRPEVCGQRRDVSCGNHARGEPVDVVNTGWPVNFFVPVEVLRPSLEQALSGDSLQLRFAAQSIEQPLIYTLGFDGIETKGKGLAPLADPASSITGIFLTVDVSRERPVILVENVAEDYRATKRGSAYGHENQRLIVFDPIDD